MCLQVSANLSEIGICNHLSKREGFVALHLTVSLEDYLEMG